MGRVSRPTVTNAIKKVQYHQISDKPVLFSDKAAYNENKNFYSKRSCIKMSKCAKDGKGKKILLFVLLIAIIGLAVYFLAAAKKEADSDKIFTMSSNAERVEFLNKQGWIVKPDPLSKEEILIPAEFNELYQQYAELQKSQGFDIEKHKGEKAMLISYQVLNYPDHTENVVANMLIADGKLIGGEITLNEENGFTEPLITAGTQALAGNTAQ